MGVPAARVMEGLASRLPPGWTLAALDVEAGRLDVTDGTDVHHLVVPRPELDELVAAGPELAQDLWPGVDAVEASIRMIAVHLEESFDSRAAGPRREWTYDGGLFEPDGAPRRHRLRLPGAISGPMRRPSRADGR